VHLRRQDTSERFVAFAFAGAEMMVEAGPDGIITYATGAFRSRFGRPAESFLGGGVGDLVAPSDHESLELALALLNLRGRLMPMMVRMSDAGRTPLALAGIVVPSSGRPPRLCMTFARPPEPATTLLRPASAQSFARTTEEQLRAGACRDLVLLEISGRAGAATDIAALNEALAAIGPDAHTSELSPGRYGMLGGSTEGDGRLARPGAIEASLREQGLDVSVAATRFSLSAPGLTPAQAARALRQALNTFARHGIGGLNEAGLGTELAGYMQRAGKKADTLRRVIREERFALNFQPIVALATRVPHHYEALIRPRPIPNLPLDSPQDFVMLVEALGLADELDLRVAKIACERAASTGLSIAFNISGQSTQNPAFRQRLVDLIGTPTGGRPGQIVVEMTETAEIDDLSEALLTANALRERGVPFCLDDFGAGTADMRTLRVLTPDIVKLDGSYVAGITAPGRNRAFVAGMVEIARAVGAQVVGERVETEAEAAVLASLGVAYGQGWLFGRPEDLPAIHRTVGIRAGEKESWG
jgi:EAL domain-containing protein (putative c-di-GMP-specific phosphodiesterase class I)/PAS domain-containing protein